MKKRGQVTIFVILGIVILLIIALLIYLNRTISEEVPPITQVTEQVPTELQPIKEHVEQCIYQIAKEGLIKLGQHGGYIYPEQFAVVTIPQIPTAASGVEFAPESDMTIPYWYYLRSSNNCESDCEFASKRPPLERRYGSKSIEIQLDNYITNNLDSCLDFKSFVYEVTPNGEIEPITTISDENIHIFVKYPLQVNQENKVSNIAEYETDVNLNLKRIYEAATEISYLEMDNNIKFFDKVTLNLVDGYSIGYDPDLPPTSGDTEFSFSLGETWLKSDVDKSLRNILMQNVPLMQIEGSEKSQLFVHEEDFFFNNIYSNFLVGLTNFPSEELNQIEIDFAYLNWWPIYLDIEPSNGELIMPDTVMSPFPPFAFKTYKFTYDISYPLVVTLKDDDAFAGQGYTFQYAFEVNVRNNQPMNTSFEEFKIDSGGVAPFADYNNRNSGLIEVKTIDHLTTEPVDETAITYVCGKDAILIGQTQLDGEDAILASKFPICHGGFVTGIKPYYYVLSTPLNTVLNKSDSVTVELEPIQTKTLEVKKKLITKELVEDPNIPIPIYDWTLSEDSSLDLEVDEQVILVLTKQTKVGEEDFVKFAYITGEDAELPTIDLVTGNYTLESYVMLYVGENRSREAVVIPEDEICIDDEPLNPFNDEDCTTIPEIRFNSTFYEGGLVLDESTQGYFTITEQDLEKDKLVIHVVTVKISDLNKAQDLQQIAETSYYSNPALYPEWE